MRNSLWIISLLVCTGVWAQEGHTPLHPIQSKDVAFALVVKGGASFSNMDLKARNANPETKYLSRAGIYLGLGYHKPLARNWAFQPELVYSSQGYKREMDPPGDYFYSDNLKQGYLGFPLLLQYVSRSGISLHSGPSVGVLFNTDPDFKDVDLLWVAGVGYISPMGLGIEGRYNYGLINGVKVYEYSEFTEARNRVAQVAIVYYFARAPKRVRADSQTE